MDAEPDDSRSPDYLGDIGLICTLAVITDSLVDLLHVPDIISIIIACVEAKLNMDQRRVWRRIFSNIFGKEKFHFNPKLLKKSLLKQGHQKTGEIKIRFSLLWKEKMGALAEKLRKQYSEEAVRLEWACVNSQVHALIKSLWEKGIVPCSQNQKMCAHPHLTFWPRPTIEKRSHSEECLVFYYQCTHCGNAPIEQACYRCLVCSEECVFCPECYSKRSQHHPLHPFADLPKRDTRSQFAAVKFGKQECGCSDCLWGSVIKITLQPSSSSKNSFLNDDCKGLVPIQVQYICSLTSSQIKCKLK